ncbi:hypothetical protein BKA56DRAFT_682422 [Ilyonectria sp. MPI-CAGE-AT-0026]|nr:hypothetical protein BKA56DRAFT_682422 [Ilyonectria sp. MPI-CAGE-AT-0026]
MPGYTSSEGSEDSHRPPKQTPKKISERNQKHKRTKKMLPQESINRIWRRFSRHQFNKALAIIPFDPVPPPVNTGRSNRLLSEDYGRAAAECRLKVEKIDRECKRVNMRYRDPYWDLDWDFKHEKGHCLNTLGQQKFELSDTSLLSSKDRVPKVVKRVHGIFENPTFMKNINGGDVKQGNLSDCWLMAGLIALANIPTSLKRICVAYNLEVGIYGFVFCRDGEWIYSIIDDKLYLKSPCWDSPSRSEIFCNKLALFFAQCKDQNETWIPLIEKAYAKAHGDYASLAGGWVGEGLEDLSGGVTTALFTSDILDRDELWNKEMSKVNKDFLFGTSTGYLENGYGERDGIAEGHAYIVPEARTLKSGQRLVKLRNPWADIRKGIWEGPWSDGSKEWAKEIQEKLGHKFGSDSVFWISYQDLMRKYSHLDRTRLFRDNDWRCFSQLDGRYFNGLHGQYSFRLHFRLHHRDSPVAGDYIARSHGNYLMNRSVSVEIPDISPGTYVVYLKVTGERDLSKQPAEEVARHECMERFENDKLAQVAYAYDLAHRKALVQMSKVAKLRQEESLRNASKSRREERRRLWVKRHAKRHAIKMQKKKDAEKKQRRRETSKAEPSLLDKECRGEGVSEVGEKKGGLTQARVEKKERGNDDQKSVSSMPSSKLEEQNNTSGAVLKEIMQSQHKAVKLSGSPSETYQRRWYTQRNRHLYNELYRPILGPNKKRIVSV